MNTSQLIQEPRLAVKINLLCQFLRHILSRHRDIGYRMQTREIAHCSGTLAVRTSRKAQKRQQSDRRLSHHTYIIQKCGSEQQFGFCVLLLFTYTMLVRRTRTERICILHEYRRICSTRDAPAQNFCMFNCKIATVPEYSTFYQLKIIQGHRKKKCRLRYPFITIFLFSVIHFLHFNRI